MDVLCVLTVMLILVNARNKQNCFMLNVFCDLPSHHTIEHKVKVNSQKNKTSHVVSSYMTETHGLLGSLVKRHLGLRPFICTKTRKEILDLKKNLKKMLQTRTKQKSHCPVEPIVVKLKALKGLRSFNHPNIVPH